MSDPSLIDKQRQSIADGLDADGLEAIRFAVTEKLRREYHQSPAFAADTADEMVGQAFIEYAEKPAAERERVRSLPGLLITTAVRRSIDKARREGREIYGEGAQAMIDAAEDQAPSTEALALRGIEAAELFEAVDDLHHEQRRALSLLYWEELSTRKAAEQMGIGTMTLCRRRDEAMDSLRARFGVDLDDPIDKHLGREAGFSAWAGLMVGGSAAGHVLSSVGDQLAGGVDTGRHGIGALWHGVAGIPGRIRDLAARIFSSGGGDGISGAVSSGSTSGLTRGLAAAGVCIVGAAGVCGVAKIAGVGPFHGGDNGRAGSQATSVRRHVRATAPAPVQRAPIPAPSHSRGGTKQHRTGRHTIRRRDRQGRVYTKSAERAARSQTLASQSPESASEPAPEPESEPTYVGEPEGGGSSSASSAASKQFGLP